MLFSAGTFLYVATVHVLPELMARSNDCFTHLPSTEGQLPPTSHMKIRDIVVLVMGSFLPLLMTTGHHH